MSKRGFEIVVFLFLIVNVFFVSGQGIEDIKVIFSNGVSTLDMTDYRGLKGTIEWAKEGINRLQDSKGRHIVVFEKQRVYKDEYVMVGNEDEGRLLKVSRIRIANDLFKPDDFSNDKVQFTDVISGDVYDTTIFVKYTGTVTVGGKVYGVSYFGDATIPENLRYVKVDYSEQGVVIYPSITTINNNKVVFYEPIDFSFSNYDGEGNSLSSLILADGDRYYTYVDFYKIDNGVYNVLLNRNVIRYVVLLDSSLPKTILPGIDRIYTLEIISVDKSIGVSTIKISDDIGNSVTEKFDKGETKKLLGATIKVIDVNTNPLNPFGQPDPFRDYIVKLSFDVATSDQLLNQYAGKLNTLDKTNTVEFPIKGFNYVLKGSGRLDESQVFIKDEKGKIMEQPALIIFGPNNRIIKSVKEFIRGDVDGNGAIDINDPVAILNFMFQSGRATCLDSADTDDSGVIDINDAVYLLNWMFLSGSAISEPKSLGNDPTPDSLDCACYGAQC